MFLTGGGGGDTPMHTMVSIQCHNLHSFEEGVILLCHSILETRHHIYLVQLSLQGLKLA